MREKPLPTEKDFNPWGDLDAKSAWKNFGGLTVEQACERFLECPTTYQEDFMFMGGIAFAYYFPVIEGYLKSVPDCDHDDDQQAEILACGIQGHFEGVVLPSVRHLSDRVIALADFVLSNIRRFGYDDEERCRVTEAWLELRGVVKSASTSSR